MNRSFVACIGVALVLALPGTRLHAADEPARNPSALDSGRGEDASTRSTLDEALPPAPSAPDASSPARSTPDATSPPSRSTLDAASPPARSTPPRAAPLRVRLSEQSIRLDGDETDVDVHFPEGRAGEWVAIVAHGFTRTRKRHVLLGERLAAAGVTTVIPDLPSIANHWTNGRALAALVVAVEKGALGLPPVPRSRIVLIGTSAGGFASLLAASEVPGVAGWIGLDPVDPTAGASDAASRMTAAAVVLRGIPSQCNLYGSARAIALAVPMLLREVKLDDATHCDFESPTNRTCSIACGGDSREAAMRVREITVAETIHLLRRAGEQAHN